MSGPEHDLRLLSDHCDDLVKERARIQKRLRWHCHDLALAPELLAFPGCSVIGAAHLVGETAGASRFSSESAFAMHAGAAPLPVSSGASQRHRLNRTGTGSSTRRST